MRVRDIAAISVGACLSFLLVWQAHGDRPDQRKSTTQANTPKQRTRAGAIRLVGRGQDFLIHAMPRTRRKASMPPVLDHNSAQGYTYDSGCDLLLTRISTGAMTKLAQSNVVVWEVRSIRDGKPIRTGRGVNGGFLGLIHDDKRLYFLVGHGGDGVLDLHVLSLPDGRALERIRLTPKAWAKTKGRTVVVVDDLPGKSAINRMAEVFAPGPLKLIAGGVSCFGVEFRFAGGKLSGVHIQPKAAPAPVTTKAACRRRSYTPGGRRGTR